MNDREYFETAAGWLVAGVIVIFLCAGGFVSCVRGDSNKRASLCFEQTKNPKCWDL